MWFKVTTLELKTSNKLLNAFVSHSQLRLAIFLYAMSEYAYKYPTRTACEEASARKNKNRYESFLLFRECLLVLCASTSNWANVELTAATVIRVESVHRCARRTHALHIDIIRISYQHIAVIMPISAVINQKLIPIHFWWICYCFPAKQWGLSVPTHRFFPWKCSLSLLSENTDKWNGPLTKTMREEKKTLLNIQMKILKPNLSLIQHSAMSVICVVLSFSSV